MRRDIISGMKAAISNVWMKGEYQVERRGEHYVPHQWSEQNGRYHFNEGRWEKGEKGQ